MIIVVILGIALQQSISNLAAIIVFMLFQPFRLGELIDANGVLCAVKEIQLLSTVLVTGDNREITIPNAEIQNHNLINYTRLSQLRVDFVFNVSYADDITKVKELLHEILAADERVLAEPAPVVFVQSLDDNGVSIAVRPWVKSDRTFSLSLTTPREQASTSFVPESPNPPPKDLLPDTSSVLRQNIPKRAWAKPNCSMLCPKRLQLQPAGRASQHTVMRRAQAQMKTRAVQQRFQM